MNVKFPRKISQHYYSVHYTYVLNLLKEIDEITLTEYDATEDLNDVTFRCYFDNKEVLFCFSDDNYKFEDRTDSAIYHVTDVPIFKFHHGFANVFHGNVLPFTPVSFHDWKQFYEIRNNIGYTCNSDIILSNQRPSGNAVKRRKQVQDLLSNTYGNNFDSSKSNQLAFWNKINNCLVSVCVPGYCNNMLDRGQLQYMALGCCTISPDLPEVLPNCNILQPQVHYIQCANDYSDLIEKIEWCKSNRKECIAIGDNAKAAFLSFGMPHALFGWIKKYL